MTFSRPPTIVSTVDELKDFLTKIDAELKAYRHFTTTTKSAEFKLFIDLEGKNLSRDGTLSIMTILVLPLNVTYLIDIWTLGRLAFTTSTAAPTDADPKASDSTDGGDTSLLTMKLLLEDRTVPKYFWDVRNDADALWSHYQVRLAGVIDVQLFENASWPRDKTYLKGLDRCIDKDLRLEPAERDRFAVIKKDVKAMMDVGRGTVVFRLKSASTESTGSAQSTDIFARRPLDAKMIEYCVGDVAYLPALFDFYDRRIKPEWRAKAMYESARRVQEACSPGYEPNGASKRFGPWQSEEEEDFQRFLDEIEHQRIAETGTNR